MIEGWEKTGESGEEDEDEDPDWDPDIEYWERVPVMLPHSQTHEMKLQNIPRLAVH